MTKHKLDPTKIAATSFDGASNFSSAKGGVHCAGICFRHHTYVCEQFFSSMKLNKSALRSRLTDEHNTTLTCELVICLLRGALETFSLTYLLLCY